MLTLYYPFQIYLLFRKFYLCKQFGSFHANAKSCFLQLPIRKVIVMLVELVGKRKKKLLAFNVVKCPSNTSSRARPVDHFQLLYI